MNKQQSSPTLDLNHIKAFCHEVETKAGLLETIKKYYGKIIAPAFNIFDFLSIDENKVSQILAFFLDPQANHEHGACYLKHFLKKFNLDFFTFGDNDTIDVKCECLTNKGRRIDILIQKNKFEQAIGIENKIYINTPDPENQLSDYNAFLNERTKNQYCLIYLSPRDKTIPQHSMPNSEIQELEESGSLKLLNYEDHIIDCLNDFVVITENTQIKNFLADFIKKLEQLYYGDQIMTELTIVSDYIAENSRNLKTAFLISQALSGVRNDLKVVFESQIKAIGAAYELKTENLKLTPSNWKNHYIAFEYESNYLLYGIKRKTPDIAKSPLPEITDYLYSELGQQFKPSQWWPGWAYFYQNVASGQEFYLAIFDGSARDKANKFVKLIVEKFNTDEY